MASKTQFSAVVEAEFN